MAKGGSSRMTWEGATQTPNCQERKTVDGQDRGKFCSATGDVRAPISSVPTRENSSSRRQEEKKYLNVQRTS